MCTNDFLRKCDLWRHMPQLYLEFSVFGIDSLYKLEYLFEGYCKEVSYTSVSSITLPSMQDSHFIGMYIQPYTKFNYQTELGFFKDFIHKCHSGQVDYFLSNFVKPENVKFITFVRSL